MIMKLLKYIICGTIALMFVACEVGDVNLPLDPNPVIPEVPDSGVGIKPTVPLKKRPIVPTTKLPRPRAVEVDMACECEGEVDFTLL